MDNLCRNPDLVVLVPASQEAEPLDIQVTLHPRAQEQPLTSATDGTGLTSATDGTGANCSPATHPSPGPPAPPSPSSIGGCSPPASPYDPRGSPLGGGGGKGTGVVSASSGGETPLSGWRRRASPGSAKGAPETPQTPPRTATSTARGSKRRGRLKISAKRPRASRPGGANGGRVARTAPELSLIHI